MSNEAESPVAVLLRRASDYAEERPWSLTAADVVDGRVAPVWTGTPTSDRPRSRARVAVPVVAVALSLALVVGLVVGLGGGSHGRRGPSPQPVGPVGGLSVLLVGAVNAGGARAQLSGELLAVRPVSGEIVRRIAVRWSGQRFEYSEFAAATGSKDAYVEGWEGHGGPIILAVPLSGHGGTRLVATAPGQSVGPMALSPGGKRLAWIRSGRLVIEDLATSRRSSVRLDRSEVRALAWSPSGDRLALVATSMITGNAEVFVDDVATGRLARVKLTRASQGAIGSATGAAWSGSDLYVGSELCLPPALCPLRAGSPLAEIDLSTGGLVRTFPWLESVSSVAVDSRTGDLVVTGQKFTPPVDSGYLAVLGGRPLHVLPTAGWLSHVVATAAWVSLSAVRPVGPAG